MTVNFDLVILLTVLTPRNRILCEASVTCVNRTADFILVVDDSGSITHEDFALAKIFLENWVQEWSAALDNGYARLGIIKFNQGVFTELELRDGTPNYIVANAVRNMLHYGGGTCIACGVRAALIMLEQQQRSGAKPVVVVLTDGLDNDPTGASNAVRDIRNTRNGFVISVVVGTADIAYHYTVFGQAYVYQVDAFAQLGDDFMATIIRVLCEALRPAQDAVGCCDRWFNIVVFVVVLSVLLVITAIVILVLIIRFRKKKRRQVQVEPVSPPTAISLADASHTNDIVETVAAEIPAADIPAANEQLSVPNSPEPELIEPAPPVLIPESPIQIPPTPKKKPKKKPKPKPKPQQEPEEVPGAIADEIPSIVPPRPPPPPPVPPRVIRCEYCELRRQKRRAMQKLLAISK